MVKIQYTELKFSCGNDHVDKNSIYSNGDLELWPNDPKINRVLPLPQGNHEAKFGKDPIYRTKVIVRKPVWTPARRSSPATKKKYSNSRVVRKKISEKKQKTIHLHICKIFNLLYGKWIIFHLLISCFFSLLYFRWILSLSTFGL